MALDGNLFTLILERRRDSPTVLDLVPFAPNAATLSAGPSSSSSNSTAISASHPLYTWSRAKAPHYNVQLSDALTDIPLANIACPNSSDKSKTIQLFNPDEDVLLEKKGMTFRQELKWKWEENEIAIRKDGRAYIVEAVRKPDPEIDIARYTPHTKTRAGMLQFLDYNMQRLELRDTRGLEILTICAVCHALDQDYDEKHKEGGNIYLEGSHLNSPWQNVSKHPSSSSLSDNVGTVSNKALLTAPSEPNEILLDMHTSSDVFVDHALRLLKQDQGGEGLHMIILRANSPDTTSRAVRIAAEIKARWYKLPVLVKGRTLDPMPGSTSEIAEELYQYVRDPSQEQQQGTNKAVSGSGPPDSSVGPRGRIKLDAPSPQQRPSTPSSSSKDGKKEGSGGARHGLRIPGLNHTAPSAAFANTLAPPSQLAIYLCKDRIDEFERSDRAHSPFAPKSSASSSPSPRPAKSNMTPPPSIPPKVRPARQGVSSSPSALPHSDSEGHEASGAKRLLGKLGLRKVEA